MINSLTFWGLIGEGRNSFETMDIYIFESMGLGRNNMSDETEL